MSNLREELRAAYERSQDLIESLKDYVIVEARLVERDDVGDCVEIVLADKRVFPHHRTIRISASEFLMVEEVK